MTSPFGTRGRRSECRYLGYSVDKLDEDDTEKELLVAKRVPAGRVEIQDVTEAARRTEGTPNG